MTKELKNQKMTDEQQNNVDHDFYNDFSGLGIALITTFFI